MAASFTARMVHPDGPEPIPEDQMVDRDYSRDPRTVMTIAEDVEQAKLILHRDNPGFVFLVGPDEVS